MKFQIQQVPYQDILPLRARVLKPHLSISDCVNPGDLRADTFHLAAFDAEKIIGIASFEFEAHPNFPAKNPSRLRGMAVDPKYHRQGLGKKLIESGLQILLERNSDFLWFNARIGAFSFYESLGFQFHGELFDLPNISLHKVMYKDLNSQIKSDE